MPDFNINFADSNTGNTALIRAARLGNVRIVEMLLNEKGINITQPNNIGTTAVIIASTRLEANLTPEQINNYEQIIKMINNKNKKT